MAGFQFTPYQPDTRSILALMQAGPAARAAALRASGEAQARAMEIGGQARAQAAQSIGQNISGSIGDFLKQREEAPYRAAQMANLQAQADERKATAEARTQAGVDQRTIDRILQEGGDPEAIVDKLRTSGNAHLIPAVQKSFDDAAARKAAYDKTVADTAKSTADAAETQQKIATAHADYLGGISADIAAHHYDPTAFFHGVALAHNDGMIDRVTAGKAIALGIQSPDQIKAFVDARIAASPEQRKLATEQAKTAATAANTAADNARQDASAAETARHNHAMEARPVAGAVGGAEGGLTPDATEYTATQYRILGPSGIPTRIETADRVKILNTAARQAKALGQTPAMAVQKQAAFKADAASLNKMTTMSGAAESFETKALAQADLVDRLSQKVDRTTSPLLNRWLLAGKAEVAGDADTQLLFNGVTTFSTEYAKIMEGSTGSVAASSDSARAAAERLIKASLNKDALQKTVAQMKWEMRQTILGYGATIEHITERMGGAAPAATTPPPAAGGAPTYADYLKSRGGK